MEIQNDFSLITMHSLRSWLATLLRQLEVPPDQTNELMHWTGNSMQRLYNRNFSAVEVRMRSRVVQVLAGDWRSAGPNHRLEPPPRWVTN